MGKDKIKIGARRYVTYMFLITLAEKINAAEVYLLMHGEFNKDMMPDNITEGVKNRIESSFEIDPEINDTDTYLDTDLLMNELIEYKRKGVI